MQRNHRRSKALALLLLFVLIAGLTAALSLLFTASHIQADNTGWHGPGTDNATSAGTGGDGFEVNPTSAYTDDNVSAENQGGLGDSHLFRDFGLAVPFGATIEGIQVRLDWYLDSDNGTSSISADLSWDGGDNWTSPLTDSVETTTEHTAYLGSSTDNWGHSWTPNEFSDGNLRVRITCNSDAAGTVFYLEYLSVIVYYAPVDYLEVTGVSSMTAGGSNVLTITARDTLGNVAVNYGGPVSLTFFGPVPAPGGQTPAVGGSNIGTPVSVAFTSGVSDNAAATTLVAYNSETTTVDVSDGISDSYTGHGLSLIVNAGDAASLDLTPDAGSSTAGSPFDVTITAYDSYANPATGYTGTVHFTSTDNNAVLPPDYVFASSDAGTHVFANGVTLRTSGSRDVTAGDTIDAGLTGTETWTVTAGATDSLDLTPNGGSATAGTPFDVTVTTYDAYGNIATGYTGTVRFTSTDNNAILPSEYAFMSSDNGTHTFTAAVTLRTSGSRDVTATDTVDAGLTGAETWSVTAGAADSLDLTPDGGSATAGTPFDVTVTTYDAYGNIATGYTGTVRFTSTDNNAILPSEYAFMSSDNGTHTFTAGVTLRTSGSRTITAADTVDAGLTGAETWTVTAGAADSLDLTPDGGSATAGTPFDVTVTTYDAYGNIATGYTGTVRFTSTDNNAILPSEYAFVSSDDGTHTFTAGVTLRTSGSRTITAADTVDADLTGTETWSVTAGAAASFDLTPNSGSATAGTPFDVTITAYDAYGNIATGYTGIVHFSSTDSNATLPGDYTFTISDSGSHIFTTGVTLRTSGSRTITAADTVDADLTGTETWTVTAGAADSLDLTPNGGSTPPGTAFDAIVTAYDAYGNIATGYTGTVRFTSTDNNAILPADYTFTISDTGSHTFTAGITLLTSGDQTVTAADTVYATMTDTQTWSVSAASAASMSITPAGGSTTAGSPFDITVTVYDAYGNIATGYTGTVRFTSTDNNAILPADYTFTVSDNGTHTFAAGVTLRTSGSRTVTAVDTANSGLTGTETWTVTAAAVDSLDLTPNGGSTTAGSAFDVTVTAHDAYGNIATGYTGILHFSSTDLNATLPADYTFTVSDNGTHTFAAGVTLRTSGSRTVTAADTVNAALANAETWSVGAGVVDHYTVTSDDYSQRVTVPFTVTVSARDAFGNQVSVNGVSVTMSSSVSSLVFDGNGDGTFGQTGDDVALLTAGTFDIQAKARSPAEGLTITATDVNGRPGTSEPYTVEDFRCFIATAAYGTPMINEIQVLRDFRDQYLMTNPPGRLFVSTYYRCSPPIARYIARHDSLRAIVRGALTPIIGVTNVFMTTTLIQKAAILLTALAAIVVGAFWLHKRRKSLAP